MKDWAIAFIQAVALFALVLWAVAALVRGAHGQQKCNVQEFSGIALSLHNPSERHQQLLGWLTHTGPSCSAEDLVVIWNNLAGWAGTADSAEMRFKVTALYEKAVAKK
jgi:hypothetical protein